MGKLIKSPSNIVVYAQKSNDPESDYLLCWIPQKYYSDFAIKEEGNESELRLKDLEKYYPNGIEVEFSTDGLREAGFDLRKYDIAASKVAYFELKKAGLLDESEMIEIAALKRYIKEKDEKKVKKTVEKYADREDPLTAEELEKVREKGPLQKILQPPTMQRGGIDPTDAFQSLAED